MEGMATLTMVLSSTSMKKASRITHSASVRWREVRPAPTIGAAAAVLVMSASLPFRTPAAGLTEAISVDKEKGSGLRPAGAEDQVEGDFAAGGLGLALGF